MEFRTLGRTGVQVSRFGLGTMVLGAWGNTDHDDCIRRSTAPLDAGINLIDTADVYAFGESEEIVGEALAGRRRDDVVLATKFHNAMGDEPNQRGNSRRWITTAVEDSLRRLRTDHIDLYQIHRPDPSTDIARDGRRARPISCARARSASWGTSTFPAADLVEACWAADRRGWPAPHSEQPPYSILCRGIERDVLPTCRASRHRRARVEPAVGRVADRQVPAVDADAPAGSRATTNPDHFDGDNDAKFDAAERLGLIAAEAGLTMTQLALAWSVEHPAVTAALIGPRTNDQLDDLLTAADVDARRRRARRDRRRSSPPGVDLNPADAGWTSPALARSIRRR